MSASIENVKPTRGAAWQRAVLPGDYARDAAAARRTPRDWLVDGALFAISVGFGALIFHDQIDHFPILNATTGVIACVSLWWRRSNPFLVGMLASTASCIAGASGVAWLIALYNSALRLDRRELTAVLVVGGIGFVTYPFLYPPDEGLIASIALGLGAAGAALGMGMLARARRNSVLAYAAAAEAAATEQRILEERARDAERRRIAREMHDVLAHRISLLSLHAAALEYRKDATPDEVTQAAEVIRESAQDALQELRDVIGVMRTGADATSEPPQPRLSDIPGLVDQFRDAGVRVELDRESLPETTAGTAAERTAYRVVQEGLVNASKHAPGALVTVSMQRARDDSLSIVIENELAAGTAVAPVSLSEPGVGLIGLGERVQLAGGRLEHGVVGTRFRLIAEVPPGDV